ncbi:MAG: hypothetical protein HY340_02650 [Candidatus Kerfeldbacteria bacterium]|nr:hypothetical protein [Candidatus Kerfeldbacteria bacterium]
MEIVTSTLMKQRAAEAFQRREVLKSTDDFDIYALPEGLMSHLVLFLWKEGKNFPENAVPRAFLMPVVIENRDGYLWEKEAALAYSGS